MDKDLLPRMKRRKRRQLWKRIVGTLGVLVVFCTVYALVLPAITLSDQRFAVWMPILTPKIVT